MDELIRSYQHNKMDELIRSYQHNKHGWIN